MFLGEATTQIPRHLGREVTVEEALREIDRADEAGLSHLIGRNKIDSVWMNVKPKEDLLSICHCCPCCCLWKVIPNLEEDIGGDEARALSMALGMSVTRVFDSDDSSIDLTAEEWKGVVATGRKLMESKRAVKDGDVMFPRVSLFRRAFWGEDPKTAAGHMRRFFKELSAWTHRALVKGQRVTISGL